MAGSSSCSVERRLRPRITKSYNEIEEGESREMSAYKYNILDKLKEERFSSEREMVHHYQDGKDLSVQFLQTHGFSFPMVFHNPEGLNIKMPSKSISIGELRYLIGGDRIIDVMDCATQESLAMSLNQFCQYYRNVELGKDKDKIMNVISLEFSHTQLDPMVEAPQVVRELDWVNKVWPKELRRYQTDPTNDLRRMMYPKVQKYCLLSVSGCYTDFHLDFGGTSVWYHVLRGEKIFFLIPPSRDNYSLFHNWQSHGKQEYLFFPDIVKECGVVRLKEGDTLLLPSGWIHGVYTPQHSLVFGGNFLHSLHIARQLDVNFMEKTLKVQNKFCYPFYGPLHWYVIEKYYVQLSYLGVQPCCAESSDKPRLPGKWLKSVRLEKLPITKHKEATEEIIKTRTPQTPPYLSSLEREGLMLLVRRMREEGLFSKDVPPSISNPEKILDCLWSQLHSPTLQSVVSEVANGLSLLDDLTWIEPTDMTDVLNDLQSKYFNDRDLLNPTYQGSNASHLMAFDDDHVTFNEDLLPMATELLTDCLDFQTLTDTSVPLNAASMSLPGPDQPVLQVNHDHSYAQFIIQSSSGQLSVPNPTHSSSIITSHIPSLQLTDIIPPLSDQPHTSVNTSISMMSLDTTSLNNPLVSNLQATPLTKSNITTPADNSLPNITSYLTSLSPPPSLTNSAPINSFQTHLSQTPPTLNRTNLTLPLTPSSGEKTTTTQPLKSKKRKKPLKDQSKPLRKVRCGQCLECQKEPCGVCKFCLDSPKYGGTGKLRKACLHRRCSNMQLSRTSSVSSPLITGSSSSLCEQHPADSTTSLGEESPLPPVTTPSLLIPKFPNILPKKEVTPNTSEILGNLETTVMAMGYAVGTGDDDKGDIDLSDILSSDANLFSTAHEPHLHDPLLSAPPSMFPPHFLTSPTFSGHSSPLTHAPSLSFTHSSPLIDNDFHLHLSDEVEDNH